MKENKGNVSIFLIIGVIIAAAFSLTGGLFSYKYTNPDTNGAFIPLSPTPQNQNQALHFQNFPFLFLTPTPTPEPTPSFVLPIGGPIPPPTGEPTLCKGTIVSFGIPKKFIPIAPWPQSGREGACVIPNYIVMHITATGETTADQIYRDFYYNYDGRGAATQYAIGKAGDAVQMLETLSTQVEAADAVGGYGDTISIELTELTDYQSRSEVPPAQYTVALKLVKALMKQYNIPLGNLDYTWSAPSDSRVPGLPRGIYGHYQLNPFSRTDPGSGFLRDFRLDLTLIP